MEKKMLVPNYIFDSSWEVCNKVGGIYTVLSTEAFSLHQLYNDNVIFIGPDVWVDTIPPDFTEDPSLFPEWKIFAQGVDQLKIRIGRWDVPGNPPVILVDFKQYFPEKDKIFGTMWEKFRVESLHSYGDYDESCMFAIATGKVIQSFYDFYHLQNSNVVALFNEWMLGMGALYTQMNCPEIATIFTTHATSIGRSIAGNNKALYAYLQGYNGDQMARELNMEAKHSIEKQTAHAADCFTTVSDLTAAECKQLLEKSPDIVTPNGFEPNFVPEGSEFSKKHSEARKTLLKVAEKLCGCTISKDAFLVSTSGRYEFRNKGLDVFIDAINKVRQSADLKRETVAFIMVPAWVYAARADLQEAVEKNINVSSPMQTPFITHWLHNMQEDRIMNAIARCGFTNNKEEKLKIIFVPCYLDGIDGIFNKPYYDLLIGMDATVYPSYYEPWGYTPLESVAFGIPTVTTNLSGFGLWAKQYVDGNNIEKGVAVVDRTDFNYEEVCDKIATDLINYMNSPKGTILQSSKNSHLLAEKAQWSKFIVYYQQAFDIALKGRDKRTALINKG